MLKALRADPLLHTVCLQADSKPSASKMLTEMHLVVAKPLKSIQHE